MRQGRLWGMQCDDRSCGDTTPPAVLYRYSPDRKDTHPQMPLKDYVGILQADALTRHLDDGRIEIDNNAAAKRP